MKCRITYGKCCRVVCGVSRKSINGKCKDGAVDVLAHIVVFINFSNLGIGVDSDSQIAEIDENNNMRQDIYRPIFALSIDALSRNAANNTATFTVRNSTFHSTSLVQGRRINYFFEWLNADNVRIPVNAQNQFAGYCTLDQPLSSYSPGPRTFTKSLLALPAGTVKLILKINQGDNKIGRASCR